MSGRRSPAQRGYRQYVVHPATAAAFDEYRTANGGLSATAALQRLLQPATDGSTAIDWEGLFLACRIDQRTAQRIREYVGHAE